MIKIEDIDLAYDNTSETFEDMLRALLKACPSARVTIWSMCGPGGGWPNGAVELDEAELDAFFEFYGIDESDRWLYV